MVAAIFLYLLFEYPFKRIIELTVLKYVSHDEVYNLHHVRRMVNSPNHTYRASTDNSKKFSRFEAEEKLIGALRGGGGA